MWGHILNDPNLELEWDGTLVFALFKVPRMILLYPGWRTTNLSKMRSGVGEKQGETAAEASGKMVPRSSAERGHGTIKTAVKREE